MIRSLCSYKTIYKKPERKICKNFIWKQRYRWKRYRSVARRNLRHFPPASGQMTPTSVCLWRHREHGDGNKRQRKRRFEPSQEMGVKKMINGNLLSEFISLLFASVYGAASSIQNCSRLWFYAYKKYQGSHSPWKVLEFWVFLEKSLKMNLSVKSPWI